MFNPIAVEVKQEILEKIKKGEKVADLAKQYGVSEVTIYSWLKKKAIGTVSLLEYNRLKNENAQLKQIIGVLTLEVEKTKKKK
jgi:transposase